MNKKSQPKIKKPNISKLKKELWKYVSLWVRERDNYTCYTCGKQGRGSFMHAGHFINRNHNNTYFDPDNLKAQCITCNLWNYGEGAIFAQKIIAEKGTDFFNQLVAKGRIVRQWDSKDLLRLIEALKNGEDYQAVYEKVINI